MNIFKKFSTPSVLRWSRNIWRGCPIFYQFLIKSCCSRQLCSFLLSPGRCGFFLMILMGNFYRPLVIHHSLLHPNLIQCSRFILQKLKLLYSEGTHMSVLFQMHFHRLTSDLGYTSINLQ